MHKNILNIVLIGFISVVMLSGCGGNLPLPTAEHKSYAETRWQGKNVNLDLGRDMYIEKCSGCHSLIAPTKFGEEKWVEEIKEMKEKAKLTDDEEFAILTYVLTEASVPRKSRME